MSGIEIRFRWGRRRTIDPKFPENPNPEGGKYVPMFDIPPDKMKKEPKGKIDNSGVMSLEYPVLVPSALRRKKK